MTRTVRMSSIMALVALIAALAVVPVGAVPTHRAALPLASASDLVPGSDVNTAQWYRTTDVVSWVIGGRSGRYSAPRYCQMLIGGWWEYGDYVDYDGAWRAYAWYDLESGYRYKQAAQFNVRGRWYWYYRWVYVGYAGRDGWYVTSDWVARL